GLRSKEIEYVFHFAKIFRVQVEAINAQHLVSRFHPFTLSVAARADLSDKAAVSDHLDLPSETVRIGALRRQKESVRIVQGIQGCGHDRQRHVHRRGAIQLFLVLPQLGIPINPMHFWIVVMLFHVIGDRLQHLLRTSPIKFGERLRTGASKCGSQYSEDHYPTCKYFPWKHFLTPYAVNLGQHRGVVERAAALTEKI